MYEDYDYEGPEPYENDLEDLMDREAFEDMVAERDEHYPESDEYDFDEGGEDDFLESAYEDRTEIEHMSFGEY